MATRRLTLREAAEVLGVSKEAVRKRALRGSLKSERGADGRVYVYVDAGEVEPPTHEPGDLALISQLREEIAYLRDESRRKDEIIMQQALTVRQLTGSSEPRESPESPGPTKTPTEGTGDPRGGPERRWWEFWR